jgi:N-acetylneuraminate synthase
MSVFVIAEAGVNHDGEMHVARDLVAAAARAGANAVKFQTFRADQLAAAAAPAAAYQVRALGREIGQRELLRHLELSRAQHLELIEECRRQGIEFLSTPFDAESVDLLMALGVARLKVPSGEITNVPYLRHVAAAGKPVLLSTGMSTLDEVAFALDVLERGGVPRRLITLLHCTTEYPTPPQDVNLRAMIAMRTAFGVDVGYSDHTQGGEVAVAAVALGATMIEKHITLSRTRTGPDHQASMEPDEFAAMVKTIRAIEVALGDGVKQPAPGERPNLLPARRSIVAAVAIKQGQVLSAANLTCKRPAIGLSPTRWDEVLGTKAIRDFQPDEPVEL